MSESRARSWEIVELGGRSHGRYLTVEAMFPLLRVLCFEGRTVALVLWQGKRPVELMLLRGRP